MTGLDDQAYFSRRAAEERQRAKASADLAIANAHLRLATEYERRLQRARATETLAELASAGQ
ncbi:MAG: hypothetical protein EON59_00350 [Alphaproteobacteria bacterium]|nr:MAG: hypothetical protein EON59_00350 [Alphaproteobacteria bacterium]